MEDEGAKDGKELVLEKIMRNRRADTQLIAMQVASAARGIVNLLADFASFTSLRHIVQMDTRDSVALSPQLPRAARALGRRKRTTSPQCHN